MSLIDNTYFINDISIPGQILTNNTTFISRYEPDILQSLLGYNLYKLLLADLDEDGLPQAERFTNLINGAEFSFDYLDQTISTKWEGLVNSKKISLIAYYCYFNYRNENEEHFTAYGQASSTPENATKVSAYTKLIHIWNKMVDLYGVIPYGYEMNFFLQLDRYDHYNAYPSAYNYLLANKDTYPEWVFTPIDKLNIFGI